MDAGSSRYYPSKRVMIDILSWSPLPKDVKIIVLSMLPLLPEYLITEILLRLPVKSLLRFKSVCREWQRIITSTGFIHTHFHRGSSFTSHIIHWCTGDFNPGGALLLEPDDDDPYDEVNLCSIYPDATLEGYNVPHLTGHIFSMQGPCNGIFCVIRYLDDAYKPIALWNPATRWFKELPSCPYIELDTRFDIGFGVDPETDELKIVLFHSQCGQRQFAVHNTRNESWKLFEQDVIFDPDYYVWRNRNGHTFLNGVLYWKKVRRGTDKTSLLAFDMRANLFQEIEMTQIPKTTNEVEATLDCFDDTLALLNNFFTVGRIDIWLMKEQGCWTKHKTVSLEDLDYELVGIWNRNQIYVSISGEVIIYDIESAISRSLGTLDSFAFSINVRRYKESLISVLPSN